MTYLASGNANPVIVPSDEWVVSGNAAIGVFPAGQTIGGVMDTYLSDNAPSSVTAPTTITGFYQVSYLVTYLASGNANPVIVPSDEWVVSGNAATGVFPAGQTIGGVMDTYLSDNAPSSVTAPTTITGFYQVSYLVTYLASGNANPVIVPSDEWVISGNAATGVFPAGQTIGGVMDTYLSDNAPSSVTAPTTITGFYQVSYLVTYLASGNANPVIVPSDEWVVSGNAATGVFPSGTNYRWCHGYLSE